MIKIEKIDYSTWPVSDYLEQVLLVMPKGAEVGICCIHYPQPTEIMAFNVTMDLEGNNIPEHYFSGKTTLQKIYKAKLDRPLCIVQFKPHAWYAFCRHDIESYTNKVVQLPCRIGDDLEAFVHERLPVYLARHLITEKINTPAYRMMPEIIRYIDKHLNTVNVIKLGQVFKVSEATLRRYFKKFVGINISHYIRNQKVKAMMLKIYRNDYNAISVQECGFYDQSHFIREFKRVHGITPTRFMEQLKRVFREDGNAEKLFRACYLEI